MDIACCKKHECKNTVCDQRVRVYNHLLWMQIKFIIVNFRIQNYALHFHKYDLGTFLDDTYDVRSL